MRLGPKPPTPYYVLHDGVDPITARAFAKLGKATRVRMDRARREIRTPRPPELIPEDTVFDAKVDFPEPEINPLYFYAVGRLRGY